MHSSDHVFLNLAKRSCPRPNNPLSSLEAFVNIAARGRIHLASYTATRTLRNYAHRAFSILTMVPLNTKMDPIILLSSPSVPSLRITTATNTNTTISSPPSSPLLSPSALLQELVEKGTAAIQKQNDTRTPPSGQAILGNIWDLSNSDDRDGAFVKLPPKRKRTPKPTGDPVAKTPRAKGDSITPVLSHFLPKSKVLGGAGAMGVNKPKAKHSRKKGVTKDGQIVAKSTKSSMPTKSPYFVRPDAAKVLIKPVACEDPSSTPEFPNKLITEPPIPPAHGQWTPMKETFTSINSSPAPGVVETSQGKDTDMESRGTLDFANMVSEMKLSKSYSRDGSALPSLGGLDKPGYGLIKKRAIEMVNLPNSSAITSSEPKASKLKQSRKKPRTITGQATTGYREAKGAASHSLLDYFTPEDATAESAAIEGPTRKRKTVSERMKNSVPPPVLLSPKAAKRQFDERECIFGSSSQLEVMAEIEIVDTPEPTEDEDAPDYMPPSTSIARRSFLKTLTKDRKGGNKLVGTRRGTNIDLLDVSIVEGVEVHSKEPPAGQPKLPESLLARGAVSRLWDAAARDSDGGLLPVEFVDMSLDNGIPSLRRNRKPMELISTAENSALSEGLALSEPVEIVEDGPVPNLWIEGQSVRPPTTVQDEGLPSLRVGGQPANAPTKNDVEEESRQRLRTEDMFPVKVTGFAILDTDETKELKASNRASSIIPKSVTTSGLGAPASIAVALLGSSTTIFNPGPRVQSEPSMPDYNAWITTRLKAEVAKYGFKDPKTRPRMVSILEQCWLAKNKQNIEQDANKGWGVAATNPLTQLTRSTSPSLAHLVQLGRPNNHPSRGYSTTGASGVSEFRGNKPTIRRVPTGSRASGPSDRGRSPTPRRRPTTGQSVAEPAIGNALRSGIQYPPKSLSPSEFAHSTPPQSPKRKDKKHKQKPTSLPPSLFKSPSKSVSPSRSRSRSYSPKRVRKMITRIILDIKPTSEGCKFSHAILMYDPISVEELAGWLNTRGIMEGGFGKHTVAAKDVKNWCISKGICCFSEDGWRVKRKK